MFFIKGFYFLFILLFVFDCKTQKTIPKEAALRMVFFAREANSQVCVFQVSADLDSTKQSLCRPIDIPSEWSDCKVYSNALEPDFATYPARSAYNQFIRSLSDIELNSRQIKTQLESVLIVGSEKPFLEMEKSYYSEFRKGFEKFKLKGYGKALAKDEAILTLATLYPDPEDATLHLMEKTESKFLNLSDVSTKRKATKDMITDKNIWMKEEQNVLEFVSCRQAFSESLRSTGKSGLENAQNCRNLIQKNLDSSKVLTGLQKDKKSKLYVYGEIWWELASITNNSKITTTSLIEKQADYCYLPVLNLMKKKKLSREIALKACYTVSFGIEYLEKLGYEEANVLESNSLPKASSVLPQVFPECNPKGKK
jgi:hypothetical protein